jgi:hypothetical protein
VPGFGGVTEVLADQRDVDVRAVGEFTGGSNAQARHRLAEEVLEVGHRALCPQVRIAIGRGKIPDNLDLCRRNSQKENKSMRRTGLIAIVLVGAALNDTGERAWGSIR